MKNLKSKSGKVLPPNKEVELRMIIKYNRQTNKKLTFIQVEWFKRLSRMVVRLVWALQELCQCPGVSLGRLPLLAYTYNKMQVLVK